MRSSRSRFALALFSLLGLLGCGGCGGAPGTLAAARPDATFVAEQGAMFVLTQAGIERVSFDGRARKLVFARPTTKSSAGTHNQWHVKDISQDFATWALGDDDTNLFVGDAATGTVREVKAVSGRASEAAFSADGKRLAIARHADFSTPGSKDDDTIHVVDVATLTTTTLPPITDHWPAKITWSADGKALWVTMNFNAPAQWVTLPDPAAGAPEKRDSGLASPPADLAPDSPLRYHPHCSKTAEADRWKPELRVVEPPGAPVVVAHLEGRERGFHDYLPDFDDPVMTPGCGHVIFSYDQRLWAVPADGRGGPGPIIEGSRITFAP